TEVEETSKLTKEAEKTSKLVKETETTLGATTIESVKAAEQAGEEAKVVSGIDRAKDTLERLKKWEEPEVLSLDIKDTAACPVSKGGSLSIWSPSKNKNSLWNKGKLKTHFEKHCSEVGANTSAEYSKMALEFGTKQSPNIIQAENGSFLYRFDPTTNEIFVGTKSGGKIKTYYIWDGRTDDVVINYFKETGLWN
ncbi:MAG: hypothetical protein IIT48_07080, partial [Lachnospiraceae bacterium]|nr:hypothetical protein [Lachnospiraceae bacterium]